ncbi:hypothetical protein [Actinoplanes sp. TFC3]|uniref:hypothetical protein n=1 Tax=Actinoplanes sp. TFC3 TaxID=1710355 RepID=UPI00128FE2BD|nr:hypothetical protein [Actinoplanes sp. TFC3]
MPPPTSGQGGPPWLGAVLAGGIALAVVLLLGCLGGALMIGRGESAEPVAVVPPDAVVSVEPEAPVNPADPVDPADPARTAGEGVAVDPPGSTETADAPQPTD